MLCPLWCGQRWGLKKKALRRRAQGARWEPAATLGIKKARLKGGISEFKYLGTFFTVESIPVISRT